MPLSDPLRPLTALRSALTPYSAGSAAAGPPDVASLLSTVQVFWQFSQDTTGYDSGQDAFIADIGSVPLYDDGTMGGGDTTVESKYHEGLVDTCAYCVTNQGYMYADDWGVLRAPTNGDTTWALWLRPDQGQDTIDLLSKVSFSVAPGGGSSGMEYSAGIDAGTLIWTTGDGNTVGQITFDVSTLLLADGLWHLLLLSYDHNTGNGLIYLDNQLLRQGSMPQPKNGIGNFALLGGNNYNGDIWGVGRWDRLWTAGERTNYYNGGAGVALVSPAP